MKRFVWGLVALLAVLHHDFWYWDDTTLLAGFLPIGLAYHAAFSVACALVWTLAVRFAWPKDLEEWAGGGQEEGATSERQVRGAATAREAGDR